MYKYIAHKKNTVSSKGVPTREPKQGYKMHKQMLNQENNIYYTVAKPIQTNGVDHNNEKEN